MEKLYDKLEQTWEKYSIKIAFCFSVLIGVLYYLGIVTNIRGVIGTIVTFASIVIGVNGVFLTLLITLQESPAFERLRVIFPSFQKRLYVSLRNQINYGLVVVFISIAISLLPNSPSKYLSSIGVFIWFLFFFLMSIGSFFSVKLVTDIIVKSINLPVRNRRE